MTMGKVFGNSHRLMEDTFGYFEHWELSEDILSLELLGVLHLWRNLYRFDLLLGQLGNDTAAQFVWIAWVSVVKSLNNE